ncbi:hypothetical protein CLF_108302 [Clonorchis sinensis]|uniref:Uncharacterized protein n=1 Tax=Clonorchis sinensis TaxID=79923 RepID=G7YHV8_CLOSI|nr:hypothetical protein CLF_108302 [Clonorchis sinensis]
MEEKHRTVDRKFTRLMQCLTKKPARIRTDRQLRKSIRHFQSWRFRLLFQKSFGEGSLSSAWKEANVTSVYKSDNQPSSGSYRPISLTNVPCEAMESILKLVIVNHFTTNNLLSQTFKVTGRHRFTYDYSLLDSIEACFTGPLCSFQMGNSIYRKFNVKSIQNREHTSMPYTPALRKTTRPPMTLVADCLANTLPSSTFGSNIRLDHLTSPPQYRHLNINGERQPLNDEKTTGTGNLSESLDPVYQSVNPSTLI